MKKKMNIVLVLIIILLLVSGIVIYAAYSKQDSYNNTDMNVIIGSWHDGSKWRQVKYTFKSNNTVKAEYDDNTSAEKDYVLVFQGNNDGNFSILNQPNVWCVENGSDLPGAPAEMKIGEEITVSDPILEYILANGPDMTDGMETDYRHDAQIALWKYLSEKEPTSQEKKNILSNISCDAPNSDKGNTIYQKAKEYADKISNIHNITINDFTIDSNGEKLIIIPKITLAGKFDVTINNIKFANNDKKAEINLEHFGDAEQLNISIKVNYPKYTVKYRILYSEDYTNQRLLVSTYKRENGTANTTVTKVIDNPSEKEYAVSLEKYITKVYSAADNYNSFVEYADREWKRYNAEGDDNNKNLYKRNKCIDVEIGDIVEYTIKVTNTGTNSFKLSQIKDTADGGVENTKLQYYKETGKYGVFQDLGDGQTKEWNNPDSNGIISPKQDTTIGASKSVYIKIHFKVVGEKEDVLGKTIENRAEVIKINGNSLEQNNDIDGFENNADADYIKVVQYRVSLQKYVTKVNGNNVYELNYDINNDGFVDLEDAKYIMRYVNFNSSGDSMDIPKNEIGIEAFEKMNVKKDEVINTRDSTELSKFVVNNENNIREGTEELPSSDLGRESWFKRLNYNNLRKDSNGNPIMEEDLNRNVSLVKYNNPVEVEIRNSANPTKITYTIKITNEKDSEFGDVEDVYVTKIYDKPEINEEKGVKLENIKYVPRGVASNYNIYEENIVGPDADGKYIIDISNNPFKISEGAEIYIDVELTLSYDPNKYDGSSVMLRNEAGILTITNSDGKSVHDSDGDDNNHDCDFIKIRKYAVSLEKYITKVTDKNGNNEVIYNNREGKRHNESLPNGSANKNVYKINNPVQLENGDKVTFTIKLTNKGNADVKITEIQDRFTNDTGLKLKFISITKGEYRDNKITFSDDTAELLSVNDSMTIEMIFAVEVEQSLTSVSQTLENKAEIKIIKNKYNILVSDSDGTANNADKDVLETKVYAVSLEKYITKVTYGTTNNEIYLNRSGKRYNDNNLSTDNQIDENESTDIDEITRHSYKGTNKVAVEPGDIVTFNIRLKNTGTTPVKVSQIYDSYTDSIEGYKLEYIYASISNSNGIAEIIDNSYRNDSDTVNRYLIDFSDPVTLSAESATSDDDTVDIEIKFKVTIPENLTNVSKILQNKAGIVELQNRNNVTVADSDGTENNYDKDWVYTKVYSVSLEKYITKVTDKNGNNAVTYNNRSGKRYNDNLTEEEIVTSSNDVDRITRHPDKDANKVAVEPGDIVTFNIRLKNTRTTPVNITQIYDSYTDTSEGVKLEYVRGSIKTNYDTNPVIIDYNYGEESDIVNGYQIQFSNPIILNPEGSNGDIVDIEIKFKVTISQNLTNVSKTLQNKAGILEMKNRNDISVADSDGTANNYDKDWVYTKTYAVSLEKFVSKLNGKAVTNNRDGNDTTSADKSEHKYDNDVRTVNQWKYDNPVTVAKDDYVTYTIKVKNDGDTKVTITNIKDYLPDGIIYGTVTNNGVQYPLNNTINTNSLQSNSTISGNTTSNSLQGNNLDANNIINSVQSNGTTYGNGNYYNGGQYAANNNFDINFNTDNRIDFTNAITLQPNNSYSFDITVKVNEPNKSLKILKNVAEIDSMVNRNQVSVQDTTGNNNRDADYIQMKDITISGIAWNDKVLEDKKAEGYNGKYDYSNESKIGGIKVKLYKNSTLVTTTYTNNNKESSEYGKYNFALDYIKAPVISGTNRWADTYNSYYVVFEYDGITYTSTKYVNASVTDKLEDSNARERLNNSTGFNGIVSEDRTTFNNKFTTIKNDGAYNNKGEKTTDIEYDTKNEEEYIPQSNYKYNSNKMAMQSSTNLINIGDITEQKLQNINLGLRGRDLFDLELTSDVYSTKVTVNGIDGEYNYNSNRVTLRKQDIEVIEDAANFASEVRQGSSSEVNQYVRNTDISVDETGAGENETTKYDSTGLAIQVTYKITVQNASITKGTATKITNYYDSKYTFYRAYSGNSYLTAEEGENGNGFKSVIITTPGTMLNQSETMDIYVVYTLNSPSSTLNALLNGTEKIATYNMAEIKEYKTQCAEGQAEYTRGLIDKDSAPGSVATERVRLTEGVNNKTTLRYYFDKNELSKLEYEDDTFATPTLYFVLPSDNGTPDDPTDDEYIRKIEGTVFEDNTTTNATTRIKTGNGKLDEGEVGVYGATVELVELNTNKEPELIKDDEGIVRYRVTTNKDGKFTISGFLPGNYIIRYRYGDTAKTVLLHQGGEGINKQSYNGEDYQATNNIGINGANQLERARENFWYLDNENKGISTATDNSTRRKDVNDYVIDFTDEEMTVLNNMRDMIGSYNNGTLTANRQYNIDKTEIIDITETKVTNINNIIESTKMYATTPQMKLTVEKSSIDSNGRRTESKIFSKYIVKDMNFGIAEVPVTIIDLEKTIQSFTLTDSTGQNVIAKVNRTPSGIFEIEGNVLPYPGAFDVSVEDKMLQGARLEVTYSISSNINVEKNFDGKDGVAATITGIVDYIDNNLSYNESLGDNSRYWEITTVQEVKEEFAKMKYKEGTTPQGTVDPEGTKYTTIVKAKSNNPILTNKDGTESATITLEKVLSSTDSTLEEIIESTVDIYEYNNTIEITGISYENITSGEGSDANDEIQRDRVRTPERYITLSGVQHDYESAETITIHPPTGDSSIRIVYYILAVISLLVITAGVFSIKKFVLNNKA